MPIVDTCCAGPVREGDLDAESVAAAVHAYVARRISHPQDREDIAQETLLRLYRNVGTLRDARAVHGWIYRIARNAVVDHYRRAAVRPIPVDPASVSDVPGETADERPHDTLVRSLPTLLAKVPPAYRQALQLVDLGGMTQEQAARQVGLSTSGMKSRVQRARRILRAEIQHRYDITLDSHGAPATLTPHNRRP